MPRLPIKIQSTLNRMKKEHQHYVEVKLIHGLYCVFESRGVYDREKKRTKKVTHYLGRILDDGTFVEAKHRPQKQAGIVQNAVQTQEHALPELDDYDRKLLTAISMNGRATYAFLGDLSGLPKNTVYGRIKHLERRYGIKYTAEIDVEKLGYLKFLIMVKFYGKVPSSEEMQRGLSGEPKVQLALSLTGGDYDLLIYVLAESNKDVNILSRLILSNSVFIEYPAEWHTMPFYETYNFVPLRKELLSTLDETATKRASLFDESMTEKKRIILKREFAVLNELNKDAKIDFTDIDKKYGFDSGRAQYSYYKLVQKKLLMRTTITMEGIPMKYLGVFFLKVVNSKELTRTRKFFLQHLVEDSGRPTNRYSLVGDIGSPYGAVLITPVYDNSDIDSIRKSLAAYRGTELKLAVATNVLIGRMCYRRFDNTYSVQAEVLEDTYNERLGQKIIYA